MQSKYDILQENEQDGQQLSQEIAQMLELFLSPLLIVLDRLLDKRLVRTFVQCCVAIIRFRNSKQGLLLSELGSYMDGYPGLSTSAAAGTNENRLKLLGIITIVYAFLLHLLEPLYTELVQAVLRFKCHRTGKRCREVLAPLYRLRWAISRLWNDHHPALGCLFPPNLQAIRALGAFKC